MLFLPASTIRILIVRCCAPFSGESPSTIFQRRNAMKNVSMYLVLACMLSMVVVGVTLVAYAGPCYVQTSTVSASQKGCYETFIGPSGQACPSKQYVNPSGVIPTDCGYRVNEKSFGVGTLGNERTGRMEQSNVSKKCYAYQGCSLEGPYFDALPLADGMYYLCNLKEEIPGSATALSFEPTGGDCVKE